MNHQIVFLFLVMSLFSSQAMAMPPEKLSLSRSYKVQAGEVQEWAADKVGYELRFNRKKIFKYEGPRIGGLPNVAFTKKFKGLDILIVDSYGGDACPNLYELIAMGSDGKFYKKSFGNCSDLDESKIKQTKNEIRFDFESHAFNGEPDNASSYVFDGKKLRLVKGHP